MREAIFQNILAARNALQRVASLYPELCRSGFWNEAKTAEFQTARREFDFPTTVLAFWLSCEFLRVFSEPQPEIQTELSSYKLKHDVERWLDGTIYVPDGAGIAALLHMRFKVRKCDLKPSSVFANFKPYQRIPYVRPRMTTPPASLSPAAVAAWQMIRYLRNDEARWDGINTDYNNVLVSDASGNAV